jgi:TonB family protein
MLSASVCVMSRTSHIAGLVLLGLALVGSGAAAQEEKTEVARKVLDRVAPAYPELARRANLRGIVKVEVVIAGNGKVKSVEVKGGSPVLADAAVIAVRKWKWESAPSETRELLEIKFEPH